ncbi:MAG: hypothetical protein DRI28_02735 [Caldiserica bacterium]|nr:MAG: hypothetical protein DRI28_02735 [Caldisericota bacterium]
MEKSLISHMMDEERAVMEAERCLFCYDAPCEKKCPAHLPISRFLFMVRSKDFVGATKLVRDAHAFINTAGYVCPEEMLCQTACTRSQIDSPVNIREVHRFLTDNFDVERYLSLPAMDKEEIAIIGGGPSGLSCAFELRKMGYKPVVFEESELGGIPVQEIFEERLPYGVIRKDTDFIVKNFVYEIKREKTTEIKPLLNKYKAVFIAIGLTKETELKIKGMELKGVYKARDLLRKIKRKENLPDLGERIGIIGGGNVALEIANTLKTLFPDREILIIYRRGLSDMKAFPEEIERAGRIGVNFYFQSIPEEIVGEGKVEGIKVSQTKLVKRDESGRRKPERIERSEFVIPLTSLITAIGQKIEEVFPEIEKERGVIKVNENLMTNIPGVFAGGDVINGGDTITRAVGDGKTAAKKIDEYLRRKKDV